MLLLAIQIVFCVSTVQTTTFPFIQDTTRTDSKCGDAVISTASAIINSTDMETVFLIYDEYEDPFIYNVTNNIHYTTKLQFVHHSDLQYHMKPVLEDLVRNENIELMMRSLNIVIFCAVACINRLLEMSKELDAEVGKKSVLRHFSRWILVSTDDHTGVSVTNLTLDNVVMLSEDKIRSDVEMSTLLWTKTGREWSIIDKGCSKSRCSNDAIFPNTKMGLNGRKLIVTALEWLPFSKKERNSNTTAYSGLSGDFVVHLSIRFNFSYQYVEPPDMLWGHRLDNGSWTGIVGMLQRETADLSSVPYAFNIERAKVMSFTYPILMEFGTVLYKKAEDENKIWKDLISCFQWHVYAVGGAVLVAVTLTYFFMLTYTPNPTKSVERMKTGKYWESFMFGLMVPLQQGTGRPPQFHSGQVLFSAWLMFSLIMAAVYRGNLMAFLAVDRLHVPFRTIQELANQDDYDVGTMVGGYLGLTIQNSEQPVMKALWKKIEETNKESPQTGDEDYKYQLGRLHKGHFAYIHSSVAADVLMSDNCDLARINEYFLPSSSGMVFPLHSPLPRLFSPERNTLALQFWKGFVFCKTYWVNKAETKSWFNIGSGTELSITVQEIQNRYMTATATIILNEDPNLIIVLMENGLYRKWYETWVPRPKTCTDGSITVGVSPLHIEEFYSALAACGAGICLAALVLFTEIYFANLYFIANVAKIFYS